MSVLRYTAPLCYVSLSAIAASLKSSSLRHQRPQVKVKANRKASRNSQKKAPQSLHVVGPSPLSSAMLIALAVAGLLFLLLVAFLFLFPLKSPPISPPLRPTPSMNAPEPQTGAMEPVFALTSNELEGPGAPNLLDSSSPQKIHFPTLQPQM